MRKMIFGLMAFLLLQVVALAALEPTPVESTPEPATVVQHAVQPVPDVVQSVTPLCLTPANVSHVVTCSIQTSTDEGDCVYDDITASLCKCFAGADVCRKRVDLDGCVTHATYLVKKPCCKTVRVRVTIKQGCHTTACVVSKHI